MKKAMAVINFLSLIALVLFLPGCGTDSVDTSSFREGTAYSLPNGGILSYQIEETTVAAVCLNRDGTRGFIALTLNERHTLSSILDTVFAHDLSWQTEMDLPQDFLAASCAAEETPTTLGSISDANGYTLIEIREEFSNDESASPVISVSGWMDHPDYILPQEAEDITYWTANSSEPDQDTPSDQTSTSESKPSLTQEEAEQEIQRRLEEQLDLITPQLEAQNALDQLDTYRRMFEPDILNKVYDEFNVIE